jgi:hypothetical protein
VHAGEGSRLEHLSVRLISAHVTNERGFRVVGWRSLIVQKVGVYETMVEIVGVMSNQRHKVSFLG